MSVCVPQPYSLSSLSWLVGYYVFSPPPFHLTLFPAPCLPNSTLLDDTTDVAAPISPVLPSCLYQYIDLHTTVPAMPWPCRPFHFLLYSAQTFTFCMLCVPLYTYISACSFVHCTVTFFLFIILLYGCSSAYGLDFGQHSHFCLCVFVWHATCFCTVPPAARAPVHPPPPSAFGTGFCTRSPLAVQTVPLPFYLPCGTGCWMSLPYAPLTPPQLLTLLLLCTHLFHLSLNIPSCHLPVGGGWRRTLFCILCAMP